MISLSDRLESVHAEVLAVVGLAKNCGKTTAVNHLIDAYGRRGLKLGLTSIGRDGEQIDVITRQPKPRISVAPGTLAVTAEGSLLESSAPVHVVMWTGIASALGELLLIEAKGNGLIELSGPTTMEETRRVISLLRESGGERIIIDGALDRISSSSPSVSDAVVLSGGAVLGVTVKSVAAKMAHQVALFRLPVISGEDAEAVIDVAKRHGRMAAIIAEDGSVTDLDGSALTQCHELKTTLKKDSRYLWAGGGVTDSMVDEILKSPVATRIVVEDATRIFLSPMAYSRWLMAGGCIKVITPIRLAALTTNPEKPNGRGLNAEELLDAVARSVPGIPVYDVTAELMSFKHA